MSTSKVGHTQRTSGPKRKWIAKATENKGALHRKLHVPEDETIPKSKLKQAAKAKGSLGKEARLAMTLSRLHKGGKAKRT